MFGKNHQGCSRFNFRLMAIANSIALSLILSACGESEGNGSSSSQKLSNINNTVEVIFPPQNANLGGKTDTTNFVFRIVNSTGEPVVNNNIKAVTVNGVQAKNIDVKNARWQAEISVATGKQSVNIKISYADGRVDEFSYSISNEPIFHVPYSIAIDDINNRALILDHGPEYVISIDLASGERTIAYDYYNELLLNNQSAFKNYDIGESRARNIAYSKQRDMLFINDLSAGIFSIDNKTKETELIVSSKAFISMTVDEQMDRLLFVDGDSLNSFNLVTNTLEEISSSQVGEGLEINFVNSVMVDSMSNKVYLSGKDSFISVNLLNGNREELVTVDEGIIHASLDLLQNRIIYIRKDNVVESLYLNTLERHIITEKEVSSDPIELAIDSQNNKAYVIDVNSGYVIEVDLVDGMVKNLSEPQLMVAPRDIAYDALNNRLVVTDAGYPWTFRDKFFEYDLDDFKSRTIYWHKNVSGIDISSKNADIFLTTYGNDHGLYVLPMSKSIEDVSVSGKGAGDSIKSFSKPNVNENDGHIYVVNGGSRITKINQETGDRFAFPVMIDAVSFDLDSENNTIYVLGYGADGAIVSVDLSTGTNKELSGEFYKNELKRESEIITYGQGPRLLSGEDIVFDKRNNRLIVIDDESELLLSVDILSGDRSIIASTDIIQRSKEYSGRPYNTVGLTLDKQNNRVFIVQSIAGSLGLISVIDLSTGSGAVIGK